MGKRPAIADKERLRALSGLLDGKIQYEARHPACPP